MPGITNEAKAYNKDLFLQGLKKCSTCKEIKPLNDFYSCSIQTAGKMSQCKPCMYIVNKARGDRKRANLDAFKKAQGCMVCGYNEDGSKLHFHHRDPSTKLFRIGNYVTVGPQKLQEEIDKCDILCVQCHTAHHNIHG